MNEKEEGKRKQAAKEFKVDAAKTELRKVLFKELTTNREKYAYRK